MTYWPKISKVNPDDAIDEALRKYDEPSDGPLVILCLTILSAIGGICLFKFL